jgi:hypothetical protein
MGTVLLCAMYRALQYIVLQYCTGPHCRLLDESGIYTKLAYLILEYMYRLYNCTTTGDALAHDLTRPSQSYNCTYAYDTPR